MNIIYPIAIKVLQIVDKVCDFLFSPKLKSFSISFITSFTFIIIGLIYVADLNVILIKSAIGLSFSYAVFRTIIKYLIDKLV